MSGANATATRLRGSRRRRVVYEFDMSHEGGPVDLLFEVGLFPYSSVEAGAQ